MKTKQVPVMIALIAGLVTCIVEISLHVKAAAFVGTLAAVLISFYILGWIVKLILDRNFREEVTEEATEEAVEENETEAGKEEAAEAEDISTEGEK